MGKNLINCEHYIDQKAVERKEPGKMHSFITALANAVNCIEGDVDPVQVMGRTGFAFRFWAHEIMCPSAMSMFGWSQIIPESLHRVGYEANYFSRLWDEKDQEAEKRETAHQAIIEGINQGIPAIVWDVSDAEWGIIIGYDDSTNMYNAVNYAGSFVNLDYSQLGANGIDVLSVAIPGQKLEMDNDQLLRHSLQSAIDHGRQKEWADRPKYENGLAAYTMWAETLQKWAALKQGGDEKKIGLDLKFCSRYYATHLYSARGYAREFLQTFNQPTESLKAAGERYKQVSENLQIVWESFISSEEQRIDQLLNISSLLRQTRGIEEEGIALLEQHLGSS
jgi:hypothetical protein